MKEVKELACLCGSDVFIESRRASGWWREIIDGYGEGIDTNLDDLVQSGTPKTVTCAECGRRLRNPRLDRLDIEL